MLPRHTVTRFLKRSLSGRNGTCIVYCENEEGDEMEFIVKLAASECGIRGLVCEVIASQLALDLDLRTPAPALLEITPEFAASITDLSVLEAMQKSIGWNFGTLKLPGQDSGPASFTPFWPSRLLPAEWRQTAAEVYAFDGMIENPDRRQDNPNCLHNRNGLVMIDHDMAFSFLAGVLFWKPVWEGGDLSMLRQHLFHHHLRSAPRDFERLAGAMESITERQLRGYALSVPEDWKDGSEIAGKILDYLVLLKGNMLAALRAIENTLR